MATSQEQSFVRAVQAAQGVRQTAYAAAFAAYAPQGFGVFANLSTYLTALVAADNAFYDSVQTAATANGISASVMASLMPGLPGGPTAAIVT